MSTFLEDRGTCTSEAGLTDRRIGLNMNNSIIFTEISFYPEISILLQIIRIIHMTIWILPEFDREGRAFCHFSFLAPKRHTQYTMRLQQTRKLVQSRAPFIGDPPLKGRNEGAYKILQN